MITEQMIAERARENRRAYQRAYREAHREEINAYQRAWNKAYRERTGKAYSTMMYERRAERELRAEMEG